MRASARTPLLAAAGCWAAFAILLVVAYALGPAERLDATALHGLGTLRGSWADPLARLFVHLADPLPLGVMLAALLGWGFALGRRRQALAAAALVIGANVTTQALKVALAHPRAQPALGLEPLGPVAFPSGHATASMSIALAALLISPVRWRATIAAAAAVYVIGVSTSTLVLVWHYPSDVLGGLLVAAAFFFFALAALRSVRERAGSGARAGARLALPARLGEAALALLAGLALLVLVRAEDLLAFARLHTAATATALAIVAASAGLLATAALISDDPA
jgi:membrane-associated phospholipid phosphatase